MLIPYGTDAPIYHFPFATIVIIVVNILVFGLQLTVPELTDYIAVMHGELNPLTWITSVYGHLGFAHIIGNMLFLGVFGLIVEGKIGWWRFTILYNLIGFIASALITLVMLMFPGGGGIGASCAIFGTMAVAMVWAPENNISVKAIFVLFLWPYIFDFEVSVLFAAFFYIATNFFFAAINGFAMSTETAHLLGVLPGLIFGVGMVLTRQVDCEGFDLVSRLRNKQGHRVKTTEQERQEKVAREAEKARIEEEYQQGIKMCKSYLNAGHFEMARKRFAVIKKFKPNIVMPEKWMVLMIQGACEGANDNPESIKLMYEYLEHYDSQAVPITLRIARFHIVEEGRPRKGLKVLTQFRKAKFSKQQAAYFNELVRNAKTQIAEGVIELDEL